MYSKYKLPVAERRQLQQLLDEHLYSCGAKLQDLHLEDKFKDVEIRDHACGDVIEKLYYSAGFEPICVYCGCDQPYITSAISKHVCIILLSRSDFQLYV